MDLIPETSIVSSLNVSPLDTSFDDINVPIAIRKGVRSCTQLPIFNFVSLGHLSPFFCSFSFALSLVLVPRNVFETLLQSH